MARMMRFSGERREYDELNDITWVWQTYEVARDVAEAFEDSIGAVVGWVRVDPNGAMIGHGILNVEGSVDPDTGEVTCWSWLHDELLNADFDPADFGL